MFSSIVPEGKKKGATDLLRIEPFLIEVPEGSMHVNPDGAEARYLSAAEVARLRGEMTQAFVHTYVFSNSQLERILF